MVSPTSSQYDRFIPQLNFINIHFCLGCLAIEQRLATTVSLNFSGKRSQSRLERGRGARISVGTSFEV